MSTSFELPGGSPAVTADARHHSSPRSSINTTDGLRLYHECWKKVADTFFHIDRLKNWARWEHRFDAEIRRSGDPVKYANRMLKSLKDEYTWLRSLEEVAEDEKEHNGDSFSGIGITYSFSQQGLVLRSVFLGSPAELAGLKPRDIIVAINGDSVNELGEEESLRRIRRQGQSVDLSFLRSGKPWQCNVTCGRVSTPSIQTDILKGNIGYIHIDSFLNLKTIEQMSRILKGKLAGCRALVLDLRANSGGYIDQALAIASMFMENAPLASMIERVEGENRFEVTVHYCGRRESLPPVKGFESEVAAGAILKWERNAHRCLVPSRVPMAVLVDEETASAGEILTGALKDNGRAVLIGRRTFGKGIGQSTYDMPGGLDIQVTTLHYRTPSGVWPGDAQRERPRLKPHMTVRCKQRFLTGGLAGDRQLQLACRLLRRKLRGVRT